MAVEADTAGVINGVVQQGGNPFEGSRSAEYPLGPNPNYLGGELSLSARLVQVSADMEALAQRSPDTNEHRVDEPYRRALTGIYARLAASLKDLTGGEAARHAAAALDDAAGVQGMQLDVVLRLKAAVPATGALARSQLKRELRAEADALLALLVRQLSRSTAAEIDR